ncbi:MAG TPA: hypothetical protein VMT24_18455 [Aggregatilineaceae bacterium]|nr:hypothetical protein [Aggregatilineaceae bacterium]
MSRPSRLPAVLAYLIPVIGWLYVFIFQRKNPLAVFHLKQAIGLFLFLVAALVAWGVIGWLLAWIPYMAVVSMALFTLVIAAYAYGILAWILGLINALSSRSAPLPLFGAWANRLPIK